MFFYYSLFQLIVSNFYFFFCGFYVSTQDKVFFVVVFIVFTARWFQICVQCSCVNINGVRYNSMSCVLSLYNYHIHCKAENIFHWPNESQKATLLYIINVCMCTTSIWNVNMNWERKACCRNVVVIFFFFFGILMPSLNLLSWLEAILEMKLFTFMCLLFTLMVIVIFFYLFVGFESNNTFQVSFHQSEER